MIFSVTKYRLSAASIVTAIPAGFLAYVLVMAFLEKPGFDKMAGFFQIISGLTLTLVTLMVLMPVGILIFGKKPEPSAETHAGGEDLAGDGEPEQAGEDLAEEEEAEDMFQDEGGDAFAEEGFEDDDLGDEEFADDDFGDEEFDDFDDEDFK